MSLMLDLNAPSLNCHSHLTEMCKDLSSTLKPHPLLYSNNRQFSPHSSRIRILKSPRAAVTTLSPTFRERLRRQEANKNGNSGNTGNPNAASTISTSNGARLSAVLPTEVIGDAMAATGATALNLGAQEMLEFEKGVCNPFSKYSPKRVRDRVVSSPGAVVGTLARGAEIVISLSLYWASLSLDFVLGRGEEMVPFRACQLRKLLCDLGPSFVKAGQVLANRPDIIREDYMNELCILQDDVPAFPSQEAFRIMEKEFGRPLEEIFTEITPRPVAAASLGQVYRATLRSTGEEVAIKVQRPGIEPLIYRDLFLFRTLASFLTGISLRKLGCNAELIVDEFGEKLLEELDYNQEARNIQSFYENFFNDPTVKIPRVYRELSGELVLVMEWIDGVRCTNPQAIQDAGVDIKLFLTTGVSAALRQLLEFGLFHGDPHPGNIFAMRDGRIAYVDFGNVAELSQLNKEILIDAIVHAVNEDYAEMAGDFTRLGFLAPGTDVTPIVPALETIWQDSTGKGLADFNFRTVTGKFNQLVYNYPIRIPERFSLVIRSLLTQEGICLSLQRDFKFLEVAYPYVAKRLLTDPDPSLRSRLIQVLFKDNMFQWKRLENLIQLAREQVAISNRAIQQTARQALPQQATSSGLNGSSTALRRRQSGNGRLSLARAADTSSSSSSGGLDLSATLRDGAMVMVTDADLRRQLLMAFTEDSRLHVQELLDIYRLVAPELNGPEVVREVLQGIPSLGRDILWQWSERILSRR
eukprot:TRINITY_DN385_c0_g5_i1.p1 TRINITY_DN385_c0_g5~~TRINITY_DN385_c0_g5_i1.p1  ORF type:complete len:753 (+),score=111.06 TRINITY_DN385_c0_g5_i1:427-2685(+)